MDNITKLKSMVWNNDSIVRFECLEEKDRKLQQFYVYMPLNKSYLPRSYGKINNNYCKFNSA